MNRPPCMLRLQLARIVLAVSALLAFTVCAEACSGRRLTDLPVHLLTTNSLPHRSSLTYDFAVMEGRTLEVSGRICDQTNSATSAIFFMSFYDKDGKRLAVQELPYSSWLNGYYSYLGGCREPLEFYFEFKVPRGASSVRICFRRRDKGSEVMLSDFACALDNTGNLMGMLLLVCFLWIFAGVSLVVWRRKKGDVVDNNEGGIGSGRAYNVCRGCVLVLTFAVVAAFLIAIGGALEIRDSIIMPSAVCGYFLFLILSSVLICSIFRAESEIRHMAIPVIMLACLGLQVVAIALTHILYEQKMYSDFALVADCITSPYVKIAHHAETFYWCNYELICSFLGKVFCRDISVAQYLNAACCTVAIFPVFKLSERIAGFRIAVFTALLMGLSPIMSVYGTMPTSEFVAAAMYIYAFYFIVRMIEGSSWTERSKYALFGGVFCGAGQLVKPLAVIFIVTAATMAVLESCRIGWRRILRWVAVLALFLGAYILTSEGVQNAFVCIAKPQRIEKGKISYARALLIGLNANTQGSYNYKWIFFVTGLSEEERVVALRNMVADDFMKFPALFVTKLKKMYSNPVFGWRWYEYSILPKRVPLWLKSLMCTWNFVVLSLVFLGVAGLAVTRDTGDGKKCVGVASVLVIAAFTSMILLIEAQERYKMAIYPIFFLVVPYVRTWFSIKDNSVYGGAIKMLVIAKQWNQKRRRKYETATSALKI